MIPKFKKGMGPSIAPYYNVAAGGGGAAFVLRTSVPRTTTAVPTAQTESVDIGTASADRLVIVGVGSQNTPTLTSVTANGVTLTQDVIRTSAGVAAIYSGLVTSGSGAQSIVANWVSAGFLNRFLWVATATGLASNLVRQTLSASMVGGGTVGSISVTSGDFMFVSEYVSASGGSGGAPTFSNSTVAPNNVNTTLFTGTTFGLEADWTILSTNASFSIATPATPSTPSGPVAAATYR